MAKVNYKETSKKILEYVGGKNNIGYLTHCMTRLRMNIKDKGLVQVDEITKTEGVMGVQWLGDQLQIIIGQTVDQLYSIICEETGLEQQNKIEENLDKKKFSINSIFDALSGCIAPIIPLFIGTGTIKIVALLLQMAGIITADSSTYSILMFVGDAGFYFLPVYMGFSAARKFGGNPMLGALMGAILLHPTFVASVSAGNSLTFFGLPVYPASYASMIFPSMISVYFMSKVEQFVAKHAPASLRTLLVPFLTILIMTPVMLCVTAPIGVYLGNYVTAFIMWVYDTVGFLGVALLSAAYPIMILAGMHAATGPYVFQAFTSMGYDPIAVPASFVSNLAIAASCLGVALKSKSTETKSAGFSFCVTTLLSGITEAALFGMVSKNKNTLVSTCIGSFAGGVVAGLFGVAAHAFPGAGGILGVPCFIGPGNSFVMALVAIGVGMVVSCVLSYITYKDEEINL